MWTGKTRGGSGGACDPPPSVREVRLLARALRERWEIGDEAREAIMKRLTGAVQDPRTRLRAVTAVTKTLAALSRVNLASIDVALRARSQEELEERIAALEARLAGEGGCR